MQLYFPIILEIYVDVFLSDLPLGTSVFSLLSLPSVWANLLSLNTQTVSINGTSELITFSGSDFICIYFLPTETQHCLINNKTGGNTDKVHHVY